MIRKEERPFWLRAQENGILGEARTRAFLLERFWLLERSVDIEGADFIIQRRLTQRSLLDRNPPRLGFVQSKYYANSDSTQYVHREYVVDEDGVPRPEFFLLCHSGNENAAKAFFLTSQEILNGFRIADESHSKVGCFILPGKDVLSQRFLILDQHTILNQIEQAIINADFFKNRSFLSWALPAISKREAPLKEEYLQPIDNWWGDIPNRFVEMRELARVGRYDLEEAIKMLYAIEKSDDPESALEIAEELEASFGSNVPLPDRLFDEDFFNAVRYHKERYNQLKQCGLLNSHAALRREIIDFIVNDLAPRMPLERDQVYIIKTKYNPNTFLNIGIEIQINKVNVLWPIRQTSWHHEDVPDYRGILNATPGIVDAYVLPGRYGYGFLKDGKYLESPAPWGDKIKDLAEMVAMIIIERILELRFGEVRS